MLEYQRQEALRQISWNSYPDDPLHNNALAVFECWQYEGITKPVEGRNFRVIRLADGRLAPGSRHDPVDERLREWLQCRGSYERPLPPENSGRLRGGMRIVLCDRPKYSAGMTISRQTFEDIADSFGLHAATLPSFLDMNGTYSRFVEHEVESRKIGRIHVMIKAAQKVEIANYLLSLTFDVATGWTNALICGHGVLTPRVYDDGHGGIVGQLLSAITLSPGHWDNPLLLPLVLLQNYTWKSKLTSARLYDRTSAIEADFKLNRNHPYLKEADPPSTWLRDIDTQLVITRLSTWAPQISFMSNCCNWLHGAVSFLLDCEEVSSNHDSLKHYHHTLSELRDNALYLRSQVESLKSCVAMCQKQIDFQANLLYSIVSQQDSVLNRQDNILNLLIARSSKQDSISMSTFTFITALFLPGTFIATLLSMTMFNWQPDAGSSDGSASGSPSSFAGTYVSDKFWIFWAIVVPLTLVTMGGWFVWFRYADYRWRRGLTQTLRSVQARGANEFFQSMLSEKVKDSKVDDSDQ